MNAPSLYNPKDNFKELYAPRVEQFVTEGFKAALRPAHEDTRKTALVLVDMQEDFVHPNGNLSVPGSQADLQRIVEFIYNNAENITSIYASLDTHNTFQIFFPSWWVYQDTGEHPETMTMVGLNKRGEAVDLMSGRAVLPVIEARWSLGTYLPTLKANAQKDLVLWTYHCIEGTPGHSLMPSLSEALAWFSAARKTQITYLPKAQPVRTEFYSIWGAEVEDPKDPRTALNTTLLDAVGKHDLIYVAGEAKSHCDLETVKMMVNYFGKTQPEIVKKHRFLMDCMSSVVVPGVDFEGMAVAEFAKLEKQGAVLVKSTDTIG